MPTDNWRDEISETAFEKDVNLILEMYRAASGGVSIEVEQAKLFVLGLYNANGIDVAGSLRSKKQLQEKEKDISKSVENKKGDSKSHQKRA